MRCWHIKRFTYQSDVNKTDFITTQYEIIMCYKITCSFFDDIKHRSGAKQLRQGSLLSLVFLKVSSPHPRGLFFLSCHRHFLSCHQANKYFNRNGSQRNTIANPERTPQHNSAMPDRVVGCLCVSPPPCLAVFSSCPRCVTALSLNNTSFFHF